MRIAAEYFIIYVEQQYCRNQVQQNVCCLLSNLDYLYHFPNHKKALFIYNFPFWGIINIKIHT